MGVLQDNLVLSTGLDHRKEIQKLTFRALGKELWVLCGLYRENKATLLAGAWQKQQNELVE